MPAFIPVSVFVCNCILSAVIARSKSPSACDVAISTIMAEPCNPHRLALLSSSFTR